MSIQQPQTSSTNLQQWHTKLKEQGHCKAIDQTSKPLLVKHTQKAGTMQLPIVSSSLVDRFAKKVEQVARKPDTLDSLFNIF